MKKRTMKKNDSNSLTKNGLKSINQKLIFITGGVVSSIGKGLTAASLGSLLEARGLTVTIMKFDPYLNVDPGTMSPFQHGEVYVTEDGAETDLDLGHYERFTNVTLVRANSVSAGQVYDAVITRERRGDYLGGTVQVIPHITDEIKKRVFEATQGSEIGIIEIGGTVGDIEAQPFFEALRQLRLECGDHNTALVHVTYVPFIAVAGELKSKPTQHSVKELREIGLQPDFLVCRSEKDIDLNLKNKIGLFCSVKQSHVISAKDSSSIYEVPLSLHKEKLDELICELLKIKNTKTNVAGWQKIVKIQKNPKHTVQIAVVGKYVELKESYKSLHEALIHGGLANHAEVLIKYVDSEKISRKNAKSLLGGVHGVLVPGGFGSRGVEGKMAAIEFARMQKKPFFGICFGMQLAAIEFARHVCGLSDATSREFLNESAGQRTSDSKKTNNIVIDTMPDQRNITAKGGTMRLGAYKCQLSPKSLVAKVYGKTSISERHRHRFEFNNQFKELFEKKGLIASGINKERNLVEVLEIKDHPWFIGVQYHPEFKSKPLSPHPLFSEFIKASMK